MAKKKEKRFLSYLRDGDIIDQIPTELTDEQVIELDDFFRNNDVFDEDSEIAITEEL